MESNASRTSKEALVNTTVFKTPIEVLRTAKELAENGIYPNSIENTDEAGTVTSYVRYHDQWIKAEIAQMLKSKDTNFQLRD